MGHLALAADSWRQSDEAGRLYPIAHYEQGSAGDQPEVRREAAKRLMPLKVCASDSFPERYWYARTGGIHPHRYLAVLQPPGSGNCVGSSMDGVHT